MRKILSGFILLVVIVVLGGCSVSVNKETTVRSENKDRQDVELKRQSVTDITKLTIPDKIVYLHDGVETVYENGKPRFERIIHLNNARQTNTLQELKLYIDYNTVAKQGDYLIYEYTKRNYAPIYFNLVQSPDGKFDGEVANYYASNLLLSYVYVKTDNSSKAKAYGHLTSADELLEYLNIRY